LWPTIPAFIGQLVDNSQLRGEVGEMLAGHIAGLAFLDRRLETAGLGHQGGRERDAVLLEGLGQMGRLRIGLRDVVVEDVHVPEGFDDGKGLVPGGGGETRDLRLVGPSHGHGPRQREQQGLADDFLHNGPGWKRLRFERSSSGTRKRVPEMAAPSMA
jgi:hypothetical protein